MTTVHKFPFQVDDHVTIRMPEYAEILHVECQRGHPCLWAKVDDKAPLVGRRFRIAGTGHPIGDAPLLSFVGTFLMLDGALVFHMWEMR